MKILTIDFDIIMKPSIQLYNDLISDNKPISRLYKDYPGLEYCLPPDLYIYESLTRFVSSLGRRMGTKSPDITFIKSHEKIVDFLNRDEPIDLINIDHHHDLGYLNYSAAYKLDCGNWVRKLYEWKMINSYIWIHNENSDEPFGASKNFITKNILFKDLKYDDLETFNKVYICHSPQWIPDMYDPLFYAWISMCEEFYGTNCEVK